MPWDQHKIVSCETVCQFQEKLRSIASCRLRLLLKSCKAYTYIFIKAFIKEKKKKPFPCPLALADFSRATLFRCDKDTFISFVCSKGSRKKIIKEEIGNEKILGLIKSVEAFRCLEVSTRASSFFQLLSHRDKSCEIDLLCPSYL